MSLRGEGTILFGGSGFLGPYILAANPGMVSVGRTPPPTTNRHIPIDSLADLRCLEKLKFDNVIYIIGNTDHHNLEKETIPPGEHTAFDYHTLPLIQTLEQLKRFPVRKFIHFSTILLYDENKISLPVSEHAPIDPYKNRYVLSKYLAEEASRFYARWLPIITVRLSNIYGPTPLQRYDLVHVLSRKLLAGERPEIWSRRPERDFIYIEDAAEATTQLLDTDYCGTLNLGTGTMTPVGKVVDILAEASGGTIVDRDIPVNGPMRFRCDMTTLNGLIPWRPKYSVEDGVRTTFETMKSYLQV